MCCPDVFPTSAFLVGLMCLTACSNFARTSADFSGRGEVLTQPGALVTACRDSTRKVDVSRSGRVTQGAILILLK